MTKFLDFGTIGLIILLLITTYGFFLFWWYWDKKGKATEAYVYVMSIYGSGAIVMGFGVYARWLRATNHNAFEEFLGSGLWVIRLIPLIICFLVITARLTLKACRARKYEQKQFDRRHSKLEQK